MQITDTVFEEDVLTAARSIYCDDICGKTFFITGATGLIGSGIAKALLECNALFDAKVTVVAFARNVEKANAVFDKYKDSPYFKVCVGDIMEPIDYSDEVDYIVHGASATGSKFFVERPVETIHIALDGTDNLMKFAASKDVKGVVYLSSLEVYGTPDGSKELIGEADYGFIENLSVRSSYSEGKRMVECLCASYASEYNVPVKIARLSQTFGAGVEYNDGRVFAEFARCFIESKAITLHTDGSTVRSYCYTTDATSAIMAILLRGEVGEAYNVTNMETACSIKEMAELVAGLPGSEIGVTIDIPDDISSFGYNPQMVIRLDSSKLMGLGWKPTVGMEEMFTRTIASMKARN